MNNHNERILWLIAARSGSKGIPNKNIKFLDDMPLLAYKIKTALSISSSDNIWISTDSEEYAELAQKYGASVPFIRPDELASDNASSMDVVLHAMKFAESHNKKYDFIGLLEPTSPFVYFEDIRSAVKKLVENDMAEAIVAVKESRPNTIFIQEESEFLDDICKKMNKASSLGRHNFKKEITPSGGFYISKWNAFLENKTFYTEKTMPYLLPDESTLEIDEAIDFDWAEFLTKTNKIDRKKLYL
jgi:CMP-N,N'-diacetyllegionaminic acid synthase